MDSAPNHDMKEIQACVRNDLALSVVVACLAIGRDGAMHRDSAIYDIGYRVEGGGLFGGHKVRMRGISRVETASPRGVQARLDAIWRSRQPVQPAS